jgi:hypothetical protein
VSEETDCAAMQIALLFTNLPPLQQAKMLNALIVSVCQFSSDPPLALALLHDAARRSLSLAPSLATTPPAGHA